MSVLVTGRVSKGDSVRFQARQSAPSSDQRCRFFARGRCKSGSRCPFKHELAEKKTSVEGGNPQTLLKKLLDKEIRRGEGRLLQLFRFFVNNDFFADTGATTAPWMFPWVDESVKVVDKRAELASLPPVDDDADEDEGKIAAPPREKIASTPTRIDASAQTWDFSPRTTATTGPRARAIECARAIP